MNDFRRYDEENPHIWEKFKEYAILTKNRGFKRYSAKSIFEIIRWHTAVGGNDGFKINNNYTADYARKMEEKFPLYKGFFATRQLKSIRK